MSDIDFWDVINRSENGPMITENEYDLSVYNTINEILKDHKIRYDPEIIIPDDNSLADDVWNAGLEAFLRIGVYNVSTRKLIKFTEEEVKSELKNLSGEVEVGEGKDKVKVIKRNVEDNRAPVIESGPHGAALDPTIHTKILQVYAQEPGTHILGQIGRLDKIHGLTTRENSPVQILAATLFAKNARKVLEMVGRKGMAIHGGVSGGVSLLQDISADSEEALRPSDIRSLFLYPEFKVDDIQLSKAAHWLLRGYRTIVGGSPMIGAWCGSTEGTAIGCVIQHLAAQLVYKGNFTMGGGNHINYHTTTNIPAEWVSSVSHQAVARNSKIMGSGTCIRAAGKPDTEQLYYEIAAHSILNVVCGRSTLASPRTAFPLFLNHVSALGTRLMVEITPFATSLKRKEANIFVKSLLSKYEDKIDIEKTDPGKPFEQIYDLETLQPKKESLDKYDGVKKELEALGIEFKK